jgi:hypothetical protein
MRYLNIWLYFCSSKFMHSELSDSRRSHEKICPYKVEVTIILEISTNLKTTFKHDESSQLCCTLKETLSLESRLQTGYPGWGFSWACWLFSYIRFRNNAFKLRYKTLVRSPLWFTIHDFIASYSTARTPAGDTMLINGVSIKFLQLTLNGGLWPVVIEKSICFLI